MPQIDITISTPISDSVRAAQVSSMFDVPPAERAEMSWQGELPTDQRDLGGVGFGYRDDTPTPDVQGNRTAGGQAGSGIVNIPQPGERTDMGQISAKLRSVGRAEGYTAGGIAHWCPGCNRMHAFAIDGSNRNGSQWTWDGNAEAPTCHPSMNITMARHQDQDVTVPAARCHYFLRAGRIEFLGDCTHALAGQTIDLPDLPA